MGILFTSSHANHLLGGEITYKHVSAKEYTIKVTLYRDCSDCKLAGQGGGTSTTNCSDLTQIFLRTTTTACANKNIGSIPLNKSGFENITEVCNQENSRCGTKPTLPYGIEAHYYTGTVDFDSYSAYKGCTLQLFIHKAERSSNISSISSEQNRIYTYALINPWIENISSPTFQLSPKTLFNHNQATYATAHATGQDGDSLYYKWGIPETDYNTPITYKSGYSVNNWMIGYCTSGSSSCTANPSSTPPEGLFLNNTTGDYIVTPTKANEKNIRVIEVEQWRKFNGVPYLAGKIRREVIALINSTPINNPPTVKPNLTYTLCVGQPFSETIAITDLPAISNATPDSVSLRFTHNITGLLIRQTATPLTSYTAARIDFIPTGSQVGTHYINITATDNQCPVYARTSTTVKIIVVPKPTVSLAVNENFCGSNELNIGSNRTVQSNLRLTTSLSDPKYYQNIQTPFSIQDLQKGNIEYHIVFTDNLGCKDSITLNQQSSGNSEVIKATLKGDSTHCSSAEISFHLTHIDDILSNTIWHYNEAIVSVDTLATKANDTKLKWQYIITRDGIDCPLVDSTNLNIISPPIIYIVKPRAQCFAYTLDLNATDAQPVGGFWAYNNSKVNPLFDLSTITTNTDTTLAMTYTFQDVVSGCSSTDTVPFVLKKSPELQLRNQSVCGTDHIYQLRNAVELPYAAKDRFITWEVLNLPMAYIHLPQPSLDIPLTGKGIYRIRATNSLPNGCTTTDTASIVVTDNITITTNENKDICQVNMPLHLNNHLNTNIEGGFWQSDVIDLTDGTFVHSDMHCGLANFTYVYDQNNCYAKLDVELNMVCKPSFSYTLPDSLCFDAIPIDLPSPFTWQNADGLAITQLSPVASNLGNHAITASITESSCIFDTTQFYTVLHPITVGVSTTQDKLCEGDTLHFTIEQQPYSFSSIISCESEYQGFNNSIYIPKKCDLASNNIKLNITSKSTAHCPSYSISLAIPYYNKPDILLPSSITGCEPLLVRNSDLPPEIYFEITNEDYSHTGYSKDQATITLSEGLYKLKASIQDNNGCTNEINKEKFIRVDPKPYASFTMNNHQQVTLSKREISLYNYSSITSGTLNSTWYHQKLEDITQFSTSNNPIYMLPADTGNFKIILVAESNFTCKDTVAQNVLVVPDIIAFIPNAFTPDNKGPKSNSVFRVTSNHVQEYNINIFNKWGQKVFASNSIEEVWNGTYLGQYCQNGVYVYSINLLNQEGKEYTFHGTVNLIR
jgi:gliding motility-associated-like protein